MAVNPLLQDTTEGCQIPVLFTGEELLLQRDSVDVLVDGLGSGRLALPAARLFLSDTRVVALAPSLGLELPLVLVRESRFHQPIFGANYLALRCLQLGPEGGPRGSAAPLDVTLTFRFGGCGTLVPRLLSVLAAARRTEQQSVELQVLCNSALQDASDPTLIFLPSGTDKGRGVDLASAYPTTPW